MQNFMSGGYELNLNKFNVLKYTFMNKDVKFIWIFKLQRYVIRSHVSQMWFNSVQYKTFSKETFQHPICTHNFAYWH